MNARERVWAALNHRAPDKVPIDLAATTVSAITGPAYQLLRDYLGMEPDPEPVISHVHQGTICPADDLLQRYEVDFRTVYMKKSPRGFVVKETAEGDFYDEYNMFWRKMDYDYSPASSPVAECTIADLASVTWPDPYDPARVAGLREEARRLYETTEYALVADIMCRGPFELAVKLRGFERFLMDLALDPTFAAALLDKITETAIGLWDVYLDAVGDYVQVVCQGDDMGMQTGLMFSPGMYRQYIKPCHKRIYEFIHAKTEAKVFMHSDGAIYDIIPDLIDIGVDILNPIQRDAKNMDIAKLKREFGSDICFWGGGIDVQQVLRTADADRIDAEVQFSIETLASGGGYVFALTHNLQPDITPDRVDQAFRSALKYRSYGRA